MNNKILFLIENCSIEPLGIMYLSSIIKKEGYTTKLHNYTSDTEMFIEISKYKPDFLCVSMTTGNHVNLLKRITTIKQVYQDIIVIVGGAHPTYFPKVQEEKYIDYIIRGEAEQSFPSLLKRISLKENIIDKDASILDLSKNLDDIPFPDRDFAYTVNIFRNNTMRNVMTGRGCPYTCTYCYNSALKNVYKGQSLVRYRTPRNVINECKEIISKYPTKMIFFADDEFSLKLDRLEEVCSLYKKEINIPFHCQTRIDVLNEERIKILSNSGCRSLTFAIESGSERIRKLLKRNMSNDDIILKCKLLYKYNIKFRTENMIGLPEETFEEAINTLRLNISVKPTYAWCSLYQPYPGTELGNYCIKEKLLGKSINDLKTMFSEDTSLAFSLEESNKIKKLQRLFSLFVSFPFLFRVSTILLRLNLLSIYTKVRDWWKKYCYRKIFITK